MGIVAGMEAQSVGGLVPDVAKRHSQREISAAIDPPSQFAVPGSAESATLILEGAPRPKSALIGLTVEGASRER